jgi:hypothetical protein
LQFHYWRPPPLEAALAERVLSSQSEADVAMLDLIFVAVSLLFLWISWLYVKGCEKV